MSVSVRVERVTDLPEHQPIVLEVEPDGTSVIYMLEDEITQKGAEHLGHVLARAKQYYRPKVPARTACAG